MMFRKCPCLRPPNDDVRTLDYRHCSLDHVPSEIFNFERTLEELLVDANQIKDLPRELFYCHGIRKLSISDNEIKCIPPAIASLINLEELDLSKNGILEIPENIKCCKNLTSVEASVNPLGKLPEGFTQLLNITHLYLNDTFLDYLPGNFGRLSKLQVLELRENHLKTLPKSLSRLTALERLDIGNNDFSELPEVVGSMTSLLEFWCDSNYIISLPASMGNLKQLIFLDASKNRIEWIPPEIEGCEALSDLYLSTNLLQELPETIGRLSNMTILKIDDNRLTSLPFSIGGLVSLSELNVSANDLEEIPPSIGLLRHLRTFHADENFIMDIPPELGSCNGLTVLSLRSNSLTFIPDEIGRIPRLRVLTLSDNRIRFLPFSLMRLKQLQALWLSENQSKPLIKLQTDIDVDTGQRMLTCYLLPQQPSNDKDGGSDDETSFHPSMWEEERARRQQIHFQFEGLPEQEGRLQRCPTPYPKEMKQHQQHIKNLALKQGNLPNGDVHMLDEPPTQPGQPPRSGSSSNLAANGPSDKPTSPLLQERHHLLKADKEKQAKDKAKMHRNPAADKGVTEPARGVREAPSPIKSPGTSRKEAADKEKDRSKPSRSQRQDDDDGGFLQKDEAARRVHSSSSLHRQEREPKYVNPQSSQQNMHPYDHWNRNRHGQPNVQPGSQDTSRDSGYTSALPPLPYFEYKKPKHSRRMRDYDSDTGYRSDHDAYRYNRHHPPHVRSDGYSSDWEPVSRRRRREGGYASDAEVYSQRSHGGHGYHPAQHLQSVHRMPYYNQTYNAQVNRHMNNTNKQALPYNYSNVPMTKRMTIRNDELYEQQFKNTPSMPNLQVSSTPKDKFFTEPPNHSSSVRSLSQQGTEAPPSRHASNKLLNQAAQAHHTGSVESDEWKRELYKASLKLNKSPAGENKARQEFFVSDDNSSNLSGRLQELTLPGDTSSHQAPPPYHPAPPYVPPGDRQQSTPQLSRSRENLTSDSQPLDLRSSRIEASGDTACSRHDLRDTSKDLRSSRPDVTHTDRASDQHIVSNPEVRSSRDDLRDTGIRSSRPDLTEIGGAAPGKVEFRRSSRDMDSDVGRRDRTDSQSSHELTSRLDTRSYSNSPHRLEGQSRVDSPHRTDADVRRGYRDSPSRHLEHRNSPNRFNPGENRSHRDSPGRPEKISEDTERRETEASQTYPKPATDTPMSQRSVSRIEHNTHRQSPLVDSDEVTRHSAHMDSNYRQSPLVRQDFENSPRPRTDQVNLGNSSIKGSRRELQFANNNEDSFTNNRVPIPMTPFNSVSHMQQHNNSSVITPYTSMLQTPGHNPSPITPYRSFNNHNLMTPYNSRHQTPVQESGANVQLPSSTPANKMLGHDPTSRVAVMTGNPGFPTPRRESTDMMIAPQNSMNQTGFDDSSLMIPHLNQTPGYSNNNNADFNNRVVMHDHDNTNGGHKVELPGYMTQTTIVTQFDKDVAMFKMNGEPASQVSSSTDSGYHGNQIFERMQEYRLKGAPPGGMSPQPHAPPSPGTCQNPVLIPANMREQPHMSYTQDGMGGRSSDPQTNQSVPDVFRIVLNKNPGLGFSIAGGSGSPGNPFRPDDEGIFITKVQPGGPADILLRPGDKILEVNGKDFTHIEHSTAVNTLKTCEPSVNLLVERI